MDNPLLAALSCASLLRVHRVSLCMAAKFMLYGTVSPTGLKRTKALICKITESQEGLGRQGP